MAEIQQFEAAFVDEGELFIWQDNIYMRLPDCDDSSGSMLVYYLGNIREGKLIFFDSPHTTSFNPYTDVKVIRLEA